MIWCSLLALNAVTAPSCPGKPRLLPPHHLGYLNGHRRCLSGLVTASCSAKGQIEKWITFPTCSCLLFSSKHLLNLSVCGTSLAPTAVHLSIPQCLVNVSSQPLWGEAGQGCHPHCIDGKWHRETKSGSSKIFQLLTAT